MTPKNRLDIHKIRGFYLGVFREPFEQVVPLEGFLLRPDADSSIIWNFENPATGDRGRFLNVAGFLEGSPVSLSSSALAYSITRQGFTLALVFPGEPRRILLNRARYTPLRLDERPELPPEWPTGMVQRRIKLRWRRISILNEQFFLSMIGLRHR